jgi:hypothetical protein
MSLIEHAKMELQIAGAFDKDSDYQGAIGEAVMELIEVFSKQGHSGMSASYVAGLFHKLAKYEPLGTLRSVTFGPDSVGENEQGFLTSKNRFVERIEAAEIAVRQGQVQSDLLINPLIGLFSEDLY